MNPEQRKPSYWDLAYSRTRRMIGRVMLSSEGSPTIAIQPILYWRRKLLIHDTPQDVLLLPALSSSRENEDAVVTMHVNDLERLYAVEHVARRLLAHLEGQGPKGATYKQHQETLLQKLRAALVPYEFTEDLRHQDTVLVRTGTYAGQIGTILGFSDKGEPDEVVMVVLPEVALTWPFRPGDLEKL